MPDPCALTMDNVTLVSKGRLRTRLTTLSRQRMEDVCAALAVAVGCGLAT